MEAIPRSSSNRSTDTSLTGGNSYQKRAQSGRVAVDPELGQYGLIGSIRRDCFDHLITANERGLRRASTASHPVG